ncbi:DIS3-like exonuclease 2 isoform X2 [Symsagittifera roscoffensis]
MKAPSKPPLEWDGDPDDPQTATSSSESDSSLTTPTKNSEGDKVRTSSAQKRGKSNPGSERNCLLASLKTTGDNKDDKENDSQSEKDIPLISRASKDYTETAKIDSKLEKISINSEKDSRKGKSMDVTMPMNITCTEMMDLIKFAGGESPIQLDEFIVKTGKVVRILEMCHSRRCVGKLRPFPRVNIHNAMFSPMDSKVPRLRIPLVECPKDFLSDPKQFENVLFAARVVNWRSDDIYAVGSLTKKIGGNSSALEDELEVLLVENGITWDSQFPPGVEATCQQILGCTDGAEWEPTEYDLKTRRDFQSTTVVSVDPPTARDLDDALHCVEVASGVYEVGVHIADVSHFVKEGTPLDDEASMRTTSTYMPNRVIPMLPRALCEHVCSLQPNKSRLAFSIVFTMNREGEVLKHWIGKSVIKSCCQMSYDHAQKMIDEPDCTSEDVPSVPSEHFEAVKEAIIRLHLLAQNMKKARFHSGALKIQKKKLGFLLDPQTGQPGSFFHHRGMESHSLIEEFMLLANITVAEKICTSMPEFGFLRRHDSPKPNMLKKLEKECELFEVAMADGSSSGGIAECLDLLYDTLKDKDEGRYLFLVEQFSKKMQLAKYFCMGAHGSRSHSHYALNVGCYTHFTSPIRRYPDVIVHRQLYAVLCAEGQGQGEGAESDREDTMSNASFSSSSLTEAEDPDFKFNIYCQQLSQERSDKQIKKLEEIAHHCNVNKLAAKRVGEGSIELFFAFFVRDNGPITMQGTVVGVLDQAVDVLLHDLHSVKRLYFQEQEGFDITPIKHSSVPQKNKATIKFPPSKDPDESKNCHEIELKIFEPLKVSVFVPDKSAKLKLKFCLD